MSSLQTFRQYCLSADQNGGTIELWRGPHELVCLAADRHKNTFNELHACTSEGLDAATFMQGVALASVVKHRHVLEVIEGGEDDGSNFYVTAFHDGERFDSWLARCHPLPPWLALQAAWQLADGLCGLSAHPRLLAGVELAHSGITMVGEQPTDLIARLCDIGLASPPAARAEPHALEARFIQEMGRLLGAMLSIGGEFAVPDYRALPEPLAGLLQLIEQPAHPQHPRTLAQLRTLLERTAQLVAAADPGARPEKVAPVLRPRLPLQSHFLSPQAVSEHTVDECTIEAREFDALDPYRYRAVQRDTRAALCIQLLPPEHLMPRGYADLLISARDRISSNDHPHLLRLLAWDNVQIPNFYVEESQPRWTLDQIVRLKGRLHPAECVLILEQLENAVRQADACDLPAYINNPARIYAQFIGPGGGDHLPPSIELARLPLGTWPAWRLRIRAWPTSLNFTQSERFQLDRLLPPESLDTATKPYGQLQHVSTRQFATLTMWMLGGLSAVPEYLRDLLHEGLSQRGEIHRSPRHIFIEHLHERIAQQQHLISTGAVPSAPTGKTQQFTLRPATQHVPPVTGSVPLRLIHPPTEPTPGFAEALFGERSRTRTVPVLAPSFDQDPANQNDSFLDRPQESTQWRDPSAYSPELEDVAPPASKWVWVMLFVLISALIGGVAAHFSGTAFWLKK